MGDDTLNTFQEFCQHHTRLVAVSKTKPVEDIIQAYDAGQRVFGENYVNELLEKASNKELLELCPDIQWHFIGRLQRNKASRVARLSALTTVETLDSARLADTLNAAREKADLAPLGVMVQVNTSNEPNKGGVQAEEAAALARHVRTECPALVFTGLMTIGAFDHDLSVGPNPDFQLLMRCRTQVAEELGVDCHQLEISMGMSADYEHAIMLGSTNVRVGSQIFGARQYKNTSNGPAESSGAPAAESGDAPGKAAVGPRTGSAGSGGGSQQQAAAPGGHSGDPGGAEPAEPARLSAVQ
ncbi:Pyridoxal phosphate homeostasis protein [Amphibalanus amphitrite]|uniref:Pyridoxal phosphate homeostasis protein n=1 Tax=Amphibalanus amphitrite TaxID=1232801 RepID=A0A6A4VZH3_AMPAM|nr:Pyridoxal phosphate homeostasis protein [Amphibalanus amphitrite]